MNNQKKYINILTSFILSELELVILELRYYIEAPSELYDIAYEDLLNLLDIINKLDIDIPDYIKANIDNFFT